MPWVLVVILLAFVGTPTLAFSQEVRPEPSHYVANTKPPDAFLALRSHPSATTGTRILAMPNGTAVRVLQKRPDGWWYLRVSATGHEGWGLSGNGNSSWILCCTK
jgi:hypothetical protein